MMNKDQFRLLYREFLFRMIDLELLSADALGDSNKLLGQLAALLIFVSFLSSFSAFGLENLQTSMSSLLYAWNFEHSLIATTFLVVGLFAVLSWDSTFPDRRDVLVLAPLPVRASTFFLAKLAAVATALSLTVILLHSLTGLAWPFALGSRQMSTHVVEGFNLVRVDAENGGLLGYLRVFAAYWITMFGMGAFTFCCVLGLQGCAAQMLPRRIFLRASSFLQLASFCVIVCVYFLQPGITPQTLIEADSVGFSTRYPSHWFFGMFQQLSGSHAFSQLAVLAWIGLATALAATAFFYALSYGRTLRKIIEEPDIVAAFRGGNWLPRFGGSLNTTIVQFAVRALFRSRLHRIILAFYLGMGFAFVIFLTQVPATQGQSGIAPQNQVTTQLLAASVIMMVFAVVGMRVTFSIPLDLRANWAFRVTGDRQLSECLKGSRWSLLLLSVAPVWILSAVFCFWRWPFGAAAGHLTILVLIGLTLVELCLHKFDKIPFTCSYLPGKSQIHMAVMGAMFLVVFILWSVEYERQALRNPVRFLPALCVLLMVWATARWRTAAHARSAELEVRFEEVEPPAVLGLGLNRDGSWPIDPEGPPP